jgi:hypothetical protein
MARTRVVVHQKGLREVFAAWAESDGEQRGRRVAQAMQAAAPVQSGNLAESHDVRVVQHPSRPVVQVGSTLDYALPIAVGTGYMARALDAAGGA